jgi:hypothetical protein
VRKNCGLSPVIRVIPRPGGDTEIKPDWISGLLIVLLIATLWAFFTGAFPYPYGWIVLMALLVMRLTAMQKKE